MRTAQPTQRSSSRSLTLRALALSLGLHAAAAAAYGGYRLGVPADSPPGLDVSGSAWVSISIRGEPGAAGSRTTGDGAVDERAAGERASEFAAQPASPAPPSPSLLPLVVAAAPAIEAIVDAIDNSLDDALAVSIECVMHPLPAGETAAEPAGDLVGVALGGGEGDAGGGGDVRVGRGLGDAGPGEGAGQGDGPGGGEAGAGVRGLGVGEHNQPPDYPQAARLAGQEGVVIVLALSDASGAVEQASIEQSSGFPLLDESALAAVRGWTFVPAVENGVAVAGYVRVPIRFVLRR